MAERVDHTTGNIWSEDETGHMVLIGNVSDDRSAVTSEKVSMTMSNKEGLMQTCCNTYNNVHPLSWRDSDGKWNLAWRCEICQRAMNLTINAKNSFPYITNGTPIVIPKDAIVIEHDKPDLQMIRALEMGVEVYRAEREKAVPSNILLFEGACPNCAYQPLTGKATSDRSTVYKCTTCGLIYKIRDTGEYYRYFGSSDLDIVEEDAPVDDAPADVTTAAAIVPDTLVASDTEVSYATGSNEQTSVETATVVPDTVDSPLPPPSTHTEQAMEEHDMTQTTEMVHPTTAPVAEFSADVFKTDEPAPKEPSLDDMDLTAMVSASLENNPLVNTLRVGAKEATSTNQKLPSTVSASDIIGTGTSSVTEIRVTSDTQADDSPVVVTKENTVRVRGHVTEVCFLFNYVPNPDMMQSYTVHPEYNNEPATFMAIHTSAVVPNGSNNSMSGFNTFIQVHPDIKVILKMQSQAYFVHNR